MKTDKQTVIELQRSKPIEQVLQETFERHQGKKLLVAHVALDLDVTDATVYNWCRDLGIDIDEYRGQEVSA